MPRARIRAPSNNMTRHWKKHKLHLLAQDQGRRPQGLPPFFMRGAGRLWGGKQTSALNSKWMFRIVGNELRNVAQPFRVWFNLAPARVGDEPKPRPPQRLNFCPLLAVCLLWGFECSSHPVDCLPALGTNCGALLGQLPRFSTIEASVSYEKFRSALTRRNIRAGNDPISDRLAQLHSFGFGWGGLHSSNHAEIL